MNEPKTFTTARAAAQLLGVSEAQVIADVREGMDGALPALNGGRYGDAWIVYQYELEGDRLTMHQARLADSASVPPFPPEPPPARDVTGRTGPPNPPKPNKGSNWIPRGYHMRGKS